MSDTPVRKTATGIWVYEPVLRELQALLEVFDNIIWLASNVQQGKYALVACTNPNIKVVVMPSVYHARFNWLYSILNYPAFLFSILKYIRNVKYIHSRGPSHPAFIAILMSLTDNKRQYWHKYAGNWKGNNIPFMYSLQRQLLRNVKKNVKVTVNGEWNTASHVISFENPCITITELNTALNTATGKDFSNNLSLLFVGNLYESKGVLNILDALRNAPSALNRITTCYIVGNGPLYEKLVKMAGEIRHMQVIVTGALNRNELNAYYEKSHFLVLPSLSEGFPKVVAEAAAYGCIPVVTSLGAIPQYIHHEKNGYLLPDNSTQSIQNALSELSANTNLKTISENCTIMCSTFTYEYYVNRVKTTLYSISGS